MTIRLGALHDALLHPGDPELAKQAAEEVANYERQVSEVRSDLTLLKWMIGVLLGLQIAFGFGNLWLTFSLISRLR